MLKATHNPKWQTLICAAQVELLMRIELPKGLIVCDISKGKDK